MEEAPERYRRERDELANALKKLREKRRMTGAQAGEQAGMSQPKISKIENGTTVPSPGDVEILCRVYNATPGQTAALSDLADSLHRHVQGSRAIMRGGAWRKQQQIAGVQATSRQIRLYQPVMVLGTLQSPAYARQVYGLSLSGDHLERSLAALRERQRILDDTTKRMTFIMSEAALRWRLCTDEIMAEQMRHLAELAARPHLRVGVIPFTTRVREVPLHGFTIYDDRLVTVGTETATLTLTSREDIDHYQRLFGLLEDAAEFEDVIALLAAIEAAYH